MKVGWLGAQDSSSLLELLSVCAPEPFFSLHCWDCFGIRIGNFKAYIFRVYRNLVDLLISSLENFLHFFSSMKM